MLIKAAAAVGIEPEGAGETQITNAAISGHGYQVHVAIGGVAFHHIHSWTWTQDEPLSAAGSCFVIHRFGVLAAFLRFSGS